MAFVVASAPHHGAPSQRSLVVDYAPFAGDAHANVAVSAARAARVRLVSAVYEALLPFNGQRVCVCCPEAADKSALFDAVLRIAMESETSDVARRARLVIATLGAEPAHLLLAGNCPTLGDEAREAHHSCRAAPSWSRRPSGSSRSRAFGRRPSRTAARTCLATVTCARTRPSARARPYLGLGPARSRAAQGVVSSDVIKSRCKTLLERRASLGLALLAGIRACCRGGDATPTTTQDMDVEDIAAGRQFPLLPFKAARVRLTEEGALSHPDLSRLRLLQLEVSATISALRAQRSRPLDELIAEDKIAVLRLASRQNVGLSCSMCKRPAPGSPTRS